MGQINLSRVVLGGVVAGIVAGGLGFLVDGVMLAPQWAEGVKALGKPPVGGNAWIQVTLVTLVEGILTVWLYAAIQPRYRAGRQTAIYAGLAAWAAAGLIPNIAIMNAAGLFAPKLTVMTTLGGIVEWVAGALAGTALYREGVSGSQ